MAQDLALVLFALICLNTLCTSVMTALAGTNWSAADAQTRFLIVISILGNLTGTLIAFFRQQITNLVNGDGVPTPPARTPSHEENTG
jgi:hypothetical protein